MVLILVPQPSRTGSNFLLEVFDWNQIEQAKSLGSCNIELESLEPFTAVERTVQLSSAKHGEKGEIRLRLLFTPEIIAKSRKNTSTFSTAGRAMTQIGHIPMGAGKGVIHGVTGVFKRRNSQSSGSSTGAPDSPGVVVSKPVDNGTLTLTQQQRPSLPPRRMRRVTTKKRAPCKS